METLRTIQRTNDTKSSFFAKVKQDKQTLIQTKPEKERKEPN